MVKSSSRSFMVFLIVFILIAVSVFMTSCVSDDSGSKDENGDGNGDDVSEIKSKIDLWDIDTGPHLRGANIYARRVYIELDGTEFLGTGIVGPPYTQADFDDLAELGANVVQISHPGLYSEQSPYKLDQNVQDNLDAILAKIEKADMFAVISFRTGPGRAEFSVCCLEETGDWFDETYLEDSVWEEKAAQDAWVNMWKYTAERYKDNSIIVGYDLMVEPNSNEVSLDVWEPEVFYQNYTDTLYDWNQLYPRITNAIREVDPDTPILIGASAYSALEWLPFLKPTYDKKTVYTVHFYDPVDYTHQEGNSDKYKYPGEMDLDWDNIDDKFNKAWLEDTLSAIEDFASEHNVLVAVNEYGPVRWTPGADQYMKDLMAQLEKLGVGHALWAWSASWELASENDAFDMMHGSNPDDHSKVTTSDLIEVVKDNWENNEVRPSKVDFE